MSLREALIQGEQKLPNPPIVEASLDIRFRPAKAGYLTLAELMSSMEELVTDFEQQHIVDNSNSNNPQAKTTHHEIHYWSKLNQDGYSAGVGPGIFVLTCTDHYTSWQDFQSIFQNFVEKIQRAESIEAFERLGLRYKNFFDKELNMKDGQDLGLRITLPEGFYFEKANFQTQLIFDDANANLTISNTSQIITEKESRVGSIVDIDSFCTSNIADNLMSRIGKLHDVEKETFFNLLSDDFIQQLHSNDND